MNKAFKFRIYPNKEQSILINKTFGCTRFIYNYFLNHKIEKYKENKESVSYNKCSKLLPSLKQQFKWLKEIDSTSLQQTLKFLDTAYKNFFRGNGFPKFKSKHNHFHSYKSQNSRNIIRLENNCIRIPKIGFIKIKLHRQIEGKILNATISKTNTNKYYVAICCEIESIEPLEKLDNKIGIDVGIKSFCTTSNGAIYDNPKILKKYHHKLLKAQRQLSSKIKGSNNFYKARIKLAKIHESIKNTRLDFLHKLSTKLIHENQMIALENLDIKSMLKDNYLAKSISDASFHKFKELLKYKATWCGREIKEVDTYFPSSQLCSTCNYKNEDVKNLNIRKWECPKCHSIHDRDINASINLLNFVG